MSESQNPERETEIRDVVNCIIDHLDMNNATSLPAEKAIMRLATHYGPDLDDDAKSEVLKRVKVEYYQY